ncbi:H-NS family nucleoid-associated regulatory protein [Paraburkholderia sp. BCC1885]|uniref:H-NS family nucleoid-associated regulatory protein n=1 Tax=Paraburkholderia sp. BCC1885 TaxID=2562669 RepID=UPI001184351A|nr:H-NS family nucleoid-associated regulatory protein [Paraburkholderia sp. BCC1885]
MATLEQIQARLKKLQAQAEAIVAKQSSVVLETIRSLMENHGLTTADIDAHFGSKKRGPKAGAKAGVRTAKPQVKYRDPKSGATWSGHGRAPGWIAKVKDRGRFLFDCSATSAAPAAATKAKVVGNYVRGPQPAKYRDPKTGATWSGRGRAPAWLVGAKDPSKFLIETADEAASAERPTTTRKRVFTRKMTDEKVTVKRPTTNQAAQVLKKAAAKRTSEKANAVKKATAKRGSRQSERNAMTDAAAVANVTVPTRGADNTR